MFAKSAAFRPIILSFFLALVATVTCGRLNSNRRVVPEPVPSFDLPMWTITWAADVAAGGFTPPRTRSGARQPRNPLPLSLYANLPAFCRVAATLKPSSDSDIKIEVWLPASGWNGKLQSVGNGGWAGVISYAALAAALARVRRRQHRHRPRGKQRKLCSGHPEKLTDFAYRSVHEMTVAAKAIVAAYYGRRPPSPTGTAAPPAAGRGSRKRSVPRPITTASSPARPRTIAPTLSVVPFDRAGRAQGRSQLHSAGKYAMIHKAALDACDAQDGVKDGLIDDPPRATSILRCCCARTATDRPA